MFDCFMLNDELDLLELRLNMLNSFVEKFVIVESNKTHSGKPKEFHFLNNQERFKKFLPKIIHLKFDGADVTNSSNAWFNENVQRNKILEALNQSKPNDSLLFVSDVDEIPRPEKLFEAKCLCCKNHGYPVAFNMFNCLYFMNFACDSVSRGPFIYNPEKAQQFELMFNCGDYYPTGLRLHACTVGHENDLISVNDAGWHFSTLGDIDQIKKKIQSYAHIEFNTDEILTDEHLLQCIEKGRPYFEKSFVFDKPLHYTPRDVSFLPDYVQLHLLEFNKYLFQIKE
jgi:beta-1,4-mannosyl-glycoprotein beta-1,4-N-acetylglucosaminyltransferase